MRTLIYILVCGLLFSCSNGVDKELILEDAGEVIEGNAVPVMTSETFQYETITQQKLQELIDLKVLAQEYPQDVAIKNQLAAITTALDFSKTQESQKITSIEVLGVPKQVNDSVQNLRVLFMTEDVKGEIFKDSITAVITTRLFSIDGVEQSATKVIFKD